jgi:translation initiation factor eIF-2B subunit epsilon
MTICSLYGVLKFLIFQVVIGQQFVVPSYSKVSLHPQPTKQDSDEELEYADDSGGL